MQVYVQDCAKMQKLPLPIFQKIYDRRLVMSDYLLNIELCQALAKGLKYNPQVIDNIYLNNCGLNEEMTGQILQGATELENLQEFTLINSELGPSSIKQLEKLMFKSFPFQLQVLKIVNCKLSSKTLCDLFDSMIANSFVSTLVIMHQKQTSETIQKLCKFLETN